MRAVDIIAKTRDRQELSREELEWFIGGIVSGEVSDYQASAWLMAVRICGLSERETADLTRAMAFSGRRLDLSSVAPFVADKHSTGGVGDKTTLVVAPLVAGAGVPVGKMSGRGLGFSGGTIDKLESIKGFKTTLTPDEFLTTLEKVGMVVAAQTPDLAPADGILYKLRDVTATVDSLPLIAASIMSKKIAAGANAVVLDVKAGSGAFMKTAADARQLAIAMRDIGMMVDLKVRAVISAMDQPLGWSVGNALEIEEAVQTLRGEGPEDLKSVALTLGAHLLHMAGRVTSVEEGVEELRLVLSDGRALAKFRSFVIGQGGDPAFIDDPSQLPQSPVQRTLTSNSNGYISRIDAEMIGRASLEVGAGRATKEADIDHSVGFVLNAKVGDPIGKGDPLAVIHAATDDSARVVEPLLTRAFTISTDPVDKPDAILDVVE